MTDSTPAPMPLPLQPRWRTPPLRGQRCHVAPVCASPALRRFPLSCAAWTSRSTPGAGAWPRLAMGKLIPRRRAWLVERLCAGDFASLPVAFRCHSKVVPPQRSRGLQSQCLRAGRGKMSPRTRHVRSPREGAALDQAWRWRAKPDVRGPGNRELRRLRETSKAACNRPHRQWHRGGGPARVCAPRTTGCRRAAPMHRRCLRSRCSCRDRCRQHR
mmetsp:Transcript_30743/g.89233  ORF Transcript_30743/g.89233 Transcript_30743/m.89233 type:complete len:215 (-) Transcript_30743:42-686(-)